MEQESTEIQNGIFTNKQLGILIFPLVIEQILAITVGMVDTMMISYAGETAISGVSLVDMLNTVLIRIFSAVSTGGAVVISQYVGKKNKKLACESANQLLLTTTLVSSAIMALALVFRKPVLNGLYGVIEPEVMKNALTYLIISSFSYPFLGIFNSCAAVFRSMGNSKLPMKISVGMNIMNAIGNAILIFGCSMGVAGAAWSSFAARATAALVMVALLTSKKRPVFLELRGILHWNGNLVKKIFYIALPNGLENGMVQGGRMLVVSIIALFGTSQIVANAVANNLDTMGCIAGEAINLAMITVVGQCVGAGDYKQAVHFTKKLLKISYTMTFILISGILIGLPLILNVYTISPEARHLAMILIFIHNGCAILLWPVSFTLSYALRAAGDVKFTMFVSIFSMCVFRILFSFLFGVHFGLGAVGVWIAMIIDWIFRSTCFVIRFRSGKWKEYKVI